MGTQFIIQTVWRSLFILLLLLTLPFSAVSASENACQNNSDIIDFSDLSGTRAYWVFFRDHGATESQSASPGDQSGLPEGLTPDDMLRLANSISPECWARRALTKPVCLPDLHDLPVWAPYVKEISAFGELRHQSRWLNGVSINVTPAALCKIRGLPFVASTRLVAAAKPMSTGPAVDEDGAGLGVTLESLPNRPVLEIPPLYENRGRDGSAAYGPSLGQLTEINVPVVHALGYSGSRVRFMIIDTGFRVDHVAFTAADIIEQRDFIFGDDVVQNETEDIPTQHNHGTGCWGTAAGYAPGNLIGPAYGASFVLAKTEVVGEETQAEEDNYVAALEWADSLGIGITSASLSYACFDDDFCWTAEDHDGNTAPLTRALDIAAGRGILCVNSQGNYSCPEPISLGIPADADSILSVGAVDSLNVIAAFSSCGPTYDGRIKPEVVARGVKTVWASAGERYTFGLASGTSLAAPLVAGAAALVMEAHPELNNMQIRSSLLATADRTINIDNLYGWGRIDAMAAIAYFPVVYPEPFSLLEPAIDYYTLDVPTEFSWQSSSDPDTGEPLEYTFLIKERDNPEIAYSYETGVDTTFTLPIDLNDDTAYLWEVSATDVDGQTRLCRKTFQLFILGMQDTPDESPSLAVEAIDIFCSPNPFVNQLHFRIEMPGSLDNLTTPPAWRIFDPTGRRLASGRTQGAGRTYSGEWDGRTNNGDKINQGVYYLEINAGDRLMRKTIVFIGK